MRGTVLYRVSSLGFVFGNGFRSPEECKVHAIYDFPVPSTKSQIQSFIGITGYYHDFIPNYASQSFHLTEATRKAAPDRVTWTPSLDQEYCYLKLCLSSSSCLCTPVPSDFFSSELCYLFVVMGVTYYSRKLSTAKRNYAISELKCLAIVASIQHFAFS